MMLSVYCSAWLNISVKYCNYLTNNNIIDNNTGSNIYSLTSLKLNGLNVEYGTCDYTQN